MRGKRGFAWKFFLIVAILIVVSVAVYFTFFFAYTCEDVSCFRSHQAECTKTKYINDAPDTTWKYHIKGEESGRCEIEVEIVKIKEGTIEKKRLEGKSMTCLLPLGSLVAPESDTTKCSGNLKEELQGLIIQKLHQYIIENLGEIDSGLTNVGVGSVDSGVNSSEVNQTGNVSETNQSNVTG